MTIRAVFIGFVLGLLVSAFTYYNDTVIGQTFLVGTLFPIGLVGAITLLMLAVNPALRRLNETLPLRPAEFAVLAAVALATCGWPGGSFFRTFVSNLTMPAQLHRTKPAWQANHVRAYVPGGAPEMASGFITSPEPVLSRLVQAQPRQGTLKHLWQQMPELHRDRLKRVQNDQDAGPQKQRELLTRAFNAAIENGPIPVPDKHSSDPRISRWQAQIRLRQDSDASVSGAKQAEISLRQQRINRRLISLTFSESIVPTPAGNGVYLNGAVPHPQAVDLFVQGTEIEAPWYEPWNWNLAWGVWWPTLKLWGGMGLLLGVSSLCLALIVHPQWSRRELLAYPVARFMHEMTRPSEKRGIPAVMNNKLFWVAFGAVIALHLVRGLYAWDLTFFEIPLRYDLSAIKSLFPTAGEVKGNAWLFRPKIFLSVVGFAFFLTTQVSLSLGLAGFVWLIFGSIMIANGVALQGSYIGAEMNNLLLFGAYLGGGLMVGYIGRRYYMNVIASACGLPRQTDTPLYAVWAARLLAICFVLSVVMLTQLAGLAWPLSILLMIMILGIVLMVSRINAETGAIMIQPYWFPVGMLTALLSIDAVGPVAYVVMAVACVVLIGDTRELIMAYLVNGLWFADHADTEAASETAPAADAEHGAQTTRRASPSRVVWPMGAMMLMGFGVALLATFYFGYQQGAGGLHAWTSDILPAKPFDNLSGHLGDLSSRQILHEAVAASGLERLTMIDTAWSTVGWIALGLALVLGCWWARLRVPWWPLHPVIFLVWGTYPGNALAWSFLIGWAVKKGVLGIGGVSSYQRVKPLMIGLIAGEMIAAIAWITVGLSYNVIAELEPSIYQILRI